MLRKVINFVRNRIREKPIDFIGQLQKNGNLAYGDNCKFENFSTHFVYPAIENFCNIKIGNNCHLQCKIILLNPHAKITIGNDVYIGDSILFCYESIQLNNNILISWGCTLIDNNTHSLKSAERRTDVTDWIKGPEYKNWDCVSRKEIIIDDDCWVGFNSIISKGVRLKQGTIVASGSVVIKSTLPYTVVGGNPAKFIKSTS